MSDLDAIAQDHGTDYDSIGGCVCGESYPCTTLGLIAEVRVLRGRVATLEDGILAKCEQWDADAPDALAYVVTDSFRRLLDGQDPA